MIYIDYIEEFRNWLSYIIINCSKLEFLHFSNDLLLLDIAHPESIKHLIGVNRVIYDYDNNDDPDKLKFNLSSFLNLESIECTSVFYLDATTLLNLENLKFFSFGKDFNRELRDLENGDMREEYEDKKEFLIDLVTQKQALKKDDLQIMISGIEILNVDQIEQLIIKDFDSEKDEYEEDDDEMQNN